MKNSVFMQSSAEERVYTRKVWWENKIPGRWKIKSLSTHVGKGICTENANKSIWQGSSVYEHE